MNTVVSWGYHGDVVGYGTYKLDTTWSASWGDNGI
jgi:hypothetical protein